MITSLGFAQQVVIENFEDPSTYKREGGFGKLVSSITTDPASGGTNGNVLKLDVNAVGEVWQGEVVELLKGKKIRATTDKTVKVDVYSSVAFTLMCKLEGGPPAADKAGASKAYTTPNAWQTLTFTFNELLDGSKIANGDYSKYVFFPNWKTDNSGFKTPPVAFTLYVDNFTGALAPVSTCANGVKDGDETGIDCGGSCTACDVDPTTAAPEPPNRNAVDVKSFFSNKYTNIPIDTWSASWDDSDVTDVQIAGDDTKKILFKNVLGIDFSGVGKHQELTAMTHFHMDFWTTNPNLVGRVLNVKLVDFGGTDKEKTNMLLAMETASNPKLESGKWVSVDVPLTAFIAGNSSQIRSDIAQLLLVSNLNAVYEADIAQPGGVVIKGALITDKAKVYVDNIYLYKVASLGTEKFETSNVKMYPNPVKNTLTIEANSTIDKIAVYSILGQEVMSKSPKSSSTTLQTSVLQKGTYIVKSTIDGKTATSKFIKE
jgi:hypothetical protein